MGIDLKKGKPGLDLQKKPASAAPSAIGAKGLDLKKGKPGLDLRKAPSASAGSNQTNYGAVPPPPPIRGKDNGKSKGKWGWFLLAIPIVAIVWVVWPKAGIDERSAQSNGQEIVSKGNETATTRTEPGTNTGTEESGSPGASSSTETQTIPAPQVSKTQNSGQPANSAKTKESDAATAMVNDNRTSPQKQTETTIIDFSSFTHNRSPIKHDAIKFVLQFGFNDTTLDTTDKEALDQFIASFPKESTPAIRIDGFACSIGSDYANYAVSQERAINVQNYLKNNGIGANVEILVSAFGSQHPTGDNSTSQGRAQNRRVAISYE